MSITKNQSSRNVLITGGAGFIGASLVNSCLNRGWRVAVYDNFSVGTEAALARYGSQIRIYRADILDNEVLAATLREEETDIVIHLAAHHYIPFCNAHPLETAHVNVVGTLSVIEASARSGVSTLVFASSGAIYRSTAEPLYEDEESPTPSDNYGLSKWIGEQLCQHYAAKTPVRFRIARLFNTYGPGETNPHLIPEILNMLRSSPTQITLGNTESKRDYVYVTDVAEALASLAACPGPESCDTANVATGSEYSAAEIVDTIGRLLGVSITVTQDERKLRAVDKMNQRGCITRMRSKYHWSPRYDIHAGLEELLTFSGFQCECKVAVQ